MNVEQEIEQIKSRNSKVEADKAWETSKTRKVCIALLTYFTMVVVMYTLGLDRPFVAALIPTLGFVLSTFSIDIVKKIWINMFSK